MVRTTDNGQLLGGADLTAELLELFEDLPGVMFCLKDSAGRYVAVNDTFVRRTSERTRRTVLGRTAGELFQPDLAERYEAQDAEVIATGRALRGELEIIRQIGGRPGWYVTTKVPLVRSDDADPGGNGGGGNGGGGTMGGGGNGGGGTTGGGIGIVGGGAGRGGTAGTASAARRVIGVLVISTDLKSADPEDVSLHGLSRAIDLVRSGLAKTPVVVPTTAQMAGAAGYSRSTLDRQMRRVFGLSPRQYVLQQRMDRAMGLLATTDTPIAQVAEATGFYDQPNFTRQLARLIGETPAQFRRRSRG
jgi:AraC-like DNA-binding protein/PAS domain-containing protein